MEDGDLWRWALPDSQAFHAGLAALRLEYHAGRNPGIWQQLAQDPDPKLRAMAQHDLALAARWCSRILLVDAGTIKADGLPEDVMSHEMLGSIYGITAHIADVDGRTIIQPLGRVQTV